jgi:hypothetical protein
MPKSLSQVVTSLMCRVEVAAPVSRAFSARSRRVNFPGAFASGLYKSRAVGAKQIPSWRPSPKEGLASGNDQGSYQASRYSSSVIFPVIRSLPQFPLSYRTQRSQCTLRSSYSSVIRILITITVARAERLGCSLSIPPWNISKHEIWRDDKQGGSDILQGKQHFAPRTQRTPRNSYRVSSSSSFTSRSTLPLRSSPPKFKRAMNHRCSGTILIHPRNLCVLCVLSAS